MLFATKKQKRYKVRRTKIKFLILPILYKGRFLWLSRVKLEEAFNGYKMMIIGIERI